MLTPTQIDLVQDSFAAVVPRTGEAAARFYTRLFELAPDTRPLFRADMDAQGRKLFLTLATIVDALDHFERILPAATALAGRHVRYGAREEHYRVVGTALIDTLRLILGAGFDDAMEAAWTAAYALLAGHMITAARMVEEGSCPVSRHQETATCPH